MNYEQKTKDLKMNEIFEEIKRDMDDFFTEIDAIIYDDNDDDELPTSDCCGAMVYEDYGICSDCKEHV